jgi:hypothetical protein
VQRNVEYARNMRETGKETVLNNDINSEEKRLQL